MELITTILQCPNCAAVVSFSHTGTNLLQCRCGSVLQKEYEKVVVKSFYIIQQPFEIIAPGATGQWNGESFTVLGRVRAWIEEFVFNYWSIVFNSGELGFLGEGYGIYAIYKEVTISPTSSLKDDFNNLKVGSKPRLFKTKNLLVERKYKCYKWELEGEAFFPCNENTFETLECSAANGQHIEVIKCSKKLTAYEVIYTSFQELNLQNLRTFDYQGKTITCTNCSEPITIYTYPYAQSFVCDKCEARYAVKEGVGFKKQTDTNKIDDGPAITMGISGQIKGISYRVIGFALKEENNVYRSRWKEYTLFNEAEGYAFLSEYNGHWIYASEKGNAPVLMSQTIDNFIFDNEDFQLFNSYSYNIISAKGEFPYNIFNDESKKVKEFISPPEIWIQEYDTHEGIIWFLGEHIDGKEIEEAFKGNVILPYKTATGAVEPKGFIATPKILLVSLVAAILLFFIHLLTTLNNRQEILMDREFVFGDSASTFSFTTKKFHLDERRSNLEFSIYAPVDNSWFELEATLVNDKTGTEYSLNKGVEYYHGYSEGEYWTEGSTTEKAYLSSIPSGDYILQLQGTRDNNYYATNQLNNFQLRIAYDVPIHRNFLICLGLLLIWPLIKYNLIRYHERNRWSNSPFSPYESEK
jgi:hypothetical protein